MKIKIVQPRIWKSATGKEKVLFKDEQGNQFDSWDLSLVKKEGQIVEGEIKSRTYQGKTFTTFIPIQPKEVQPKEEKAEKKPEFQPVPVEVWEKKDRWLAKESAWKSACSLYQGTGKVEEARALAKEIFEDIINSHKKTEEEEIEEYIEEHSEEIDEALERSIREDEAN